MTKLDYVIKNGETALVVESEETPDIQSNKERVNTISEEVKKHIKEND